jgi:uroporphyrinogen decarboxylase
MMQGNDLFLKACRSEPVDRVPVWFMRQAGRSLPGYRKIRETYGVLEIAQTPELAAEVSLEPVKKLGVDAAILFADIMLLPLAMDVDVKIVDAVGPVIGAPIGGCRDIDRLAPFDPMRVGYLAKTIAILRSELDVPLIGFSGAPFTLASYLIEGRPTRTWIKTKRFMLEQSDDWNALMEILSNAIIGYLSLQIGAGAQAVQLFDSWVGCLSPSEYRQYVLPHVRRIFSALREKNVPRIHFGTDTGAMLKDFANVNCEVIGVDWRADIGAAKAAIGGKAIQGNLDPVILLADEKTIQRHADEILHAIDPKKGFIFNLGHGVLPETDDRKVRNLVDYLHAQ